MRPLFKALAVWVTGLLAVTGAGCSPKSRIARHVESAARDMAAGKLERAEIEYLNVMRLEPANPTAIAQLGIIYFEQGRIGRAAPFLVKGRELNPQNLELRAKLATLLLATGKTADARAEAEYILDHQPGNAEGAILLAQAAQQPPEVADARQRLAALPTSAAVQVALGTLALRDRDPEGAEAAFKEALRMDPDSAAAHAGLGALYLGRSELKLAEHELAEAARLSPARSAHRMQYAEFKIRSGDVDGATGILHDINAQAPDYVPASVRLAELTAAQRKFDESTRLVQGVLAKDPTNPEALLLQGKLKLAQGDVDGAVKQMEQLATMFPRAAQVHYQLALAYLAENETSKAVSSLNRTLAITPDATDAILQLANVNLRRGDVIAAITPLQALVGKRPTLVPAQLLLANAYRAQRKYADALQVYSELETRFPNEPQMPLLRGLILLQDQRPDDARTAFAKALELNPRYLPALEQLVNLDLREARQDQALAQLDGLAGDERIRPELEVLRAKVFLSRKQTDQAEAALQQAIALRPDARTPYMLLANLYISENRHEAALKHLQDVLDRNPRDVGALMLTGLIHDNTGDRVAARTAYQKSAGNRPAIGGRTQQPRVSLFRTLWRIGKGLRSRQPRSRAPADRSIHGGHARVDSFPKTRLPARAQPSPGECVPHDRIG